VATKCCIHRINKSESMYPVPRELTVPMDPGGAPVINASTILLRGKMKSGGTNMPAALMQHNAVTFLPRSPLTAFRICRVPDEHTTLDGFATVLKPVSSQFQIRVGSKCRICSTPRYTSKKFAAEFLLKPSSLAWLVGMGALTVKFGWRAKKPASQSLPAIRQALSNPYAVDLHAPRVQRQVCVHP